MSKPVWPLRRADGLPVVMGVVNVTPDSFSDGGQWFEPTAAIDHGRELLDYVLADLPPGCIAAA